LPELRVILVDDEPLVRSGLRQLLDQEADLVITAEARNGSEALQMIRTHAPDVVFLDVQMPGMDGFEMLAELEMESRPLVVFVTAFDQYAIRAFDVHAVDYLLKPFDEVRLRLAMQRVRSRTFESRAEDAHRLQSLLEDLRRQPRYPDRLLLKHDGDMVVVLTEDIDWIEAADNYVKVHARGARYMVRESIKSMEAKLDPRRFSRSHRSAIVNLQRVRLLQPLAAGEYVITLTSGARIMLSRGYRDSFREALQGNQSR
jgi:two-component system LytT family response regulator